ncbi:hypothetical protein P4645_03415 [Lysinibacillus fusiformis]|uniref:hypothetical protein n=1 Tax=Lysinibacillus fusiformis TaxID=28031 RepID=UPI0000F373DA|nr:hypothetical protein [Lysinibacillus fusiformis]EAZ84711.1 hypothetical protein BB14905_19550 [Bacillus sp. B14905]MED4075286.1 hypothetical protein [Lysinibacillus fusiformis]
MLFKKYRDSRIQAFSYHTLFKTLQDLYNDELSEMLVYVKDIPNAEYENGRLLLIFSEKKLIKVTFDEENVEVRPIEYVDVKYSFRMNSVLSKREELALNIENEEILLNPSIDFSPYHQSNYPNIIILIYKFLSTK